MAAEGSGRRRPSTERRYRAPKGRTAITYTYLMVAFVREEDLVVAQRMADSKADVITEAKPLLDPWTCGGEWSLRMQCMRRRGWRGTF